MNIRRFVVLVLLNSFIFCSPLLWAGKSSGGGTSSTASQKKEEKKELTETEKEFLSAKRRPKGKKYWNSLSETERKNLLKQYDTNKDGKLDKDERAQALQSSQKKDSRKDQKKNNDKPVS